MIPSTSVLSNPLGTLSKLLYTHDSIIDFSQLKPSGVKKKDLKFLLEQSKTEQEKSSFRGILEKERLYMNHFFENLSYLKGQNIIFLDFQNLCLEDKFGNLTKDCVDDFAAESEVSKYLLSLYKSMPSEAKEFMQEFIFYRLSPYDFPFMIREDEKSAYITHPFPEILGSINQKMEEKGKTPFGDHFRYEEDVSTKGNYKFSLPIISVSSFRDLFDSDVSFEKLLQDYNKTHENVEREEFSRLAECAIKMNREIIKQKYRKVLSFLQPQETIAYMLEGDEGKKLLDSIEPSIRVPGKKLLKNTKGMPLRGVLENTALNCLSGWVSARSKSSSQRMEKGDYNEEVKLDNSENHPSIRTYGGVDTLDSLLESVPKETLDALEQDTKKYSFSVSPIEWVILNLNFRNYKVQTSERETTWQNVLDKRVVPYSPREIAKVRGVVRPSNAGKKCELMRYIQVFKHEFYPERATHAARSGNSLHTIANELETEDFEILENYGLPSMKREEYCEARLRHSYQPSSEEWDEAKQVIEKQLKKTGNGFYRLMLDELEEQREKDQVIEDYGKADGVAMMYPSEEPVIIDFKRRTSNAYPVNYFFEQASRYAMALDQMEELDADVYNLVIVQGPFTPNKYLNKEISLEHSFREQKLWIRRVGVEDDFLKNTKLNIIHEHIGNTVLRENNSNGWYLRRMYGGKECEKCFANNDEINDFSCRYLLTGRDISW